MKPILLIHGAWHGAWCWSKLLPALKARGIAATAIDLPGQGDDPTPPGEVTLELWSDRIVAALDELAEPAILVGHSMGGIAITAAAETAPESVAALVYLCAFLPRDGETLASLAQGIPPEQTALRQEPVLGGTAIMPVGETVEAAFYGGCSQADIADAKARLRPLPLQPLAAPVRLTPGRTDGIPRIYIECTEDRALPIETQRRMIAATPCQAVHTLAAGHSPFLSMPARLAEIVAGV
jgi:pimeloyl-ACP methyl ester carboxylesterase